MKRELREHIYILYIYISEISIDMNRVASLAQLINDLWSGRADPLPLIYINGKGSPPPESRVGRPG